jgi:hypothetical protein
VQHTEPETRHCYLRRPEEFGNAGNLNVQIQKVICVAEYLVIFAEKTIEDVGTFVKNSFHPHFKTGTLEERQKHIDASKPKKNLDLFFQIDDYINSKIKKVCKDMPRIYRNMKFMRFFMTCGYRCGKPKHTYVEETLSKEIRFRETSDRG